MTFKNSHQLTKLLHGAYKPFDWGATNVPIFQTSSFAHNKAEDLAAIFEGKSYGYTYSRIHNPTVDFLEKKITVLEDGLGSIACSSGMAAISMTILTLMEQGDEILAGKSIFGGTYSLFNRTLPRYGIRTKFAEIRDIETFKKAISPKTRLIFVETIGNPKLDVANIKSLSLLAKEHNLILVVDNTITTPLLIQPKQHGADIVIHSTTKFLNGHGNSIGGIIVDSGTFNWKESSSTFVREQSQKAGEFAFIKALRTQIHKDFGCVLSPFNAFLTLTGIESLGVRMDRHCNNALKVANLLKADSRVCEISYPGFENHPEHELAKEQFKGNYGSILTIKLGTQKRCFEFINNLKLAQNLANLGDTKTLIVHPASTICKDATIEQRKSMGVTDDLIRISIGLEYWGDIKNDFEQALNFINKE